MFLHVASVHEASGLASVCSLEVLALVHYFRHKRTILAQRELVNARLHMDITIIIEHAQLVQEAQRQALGVMSVRGQIVGNDGVQKGMVDVVLVSAVQQDRTHGKHQGMADDRL